MPSGSESLLRLRVPKKRVYRYPLAVAIVAAATLARLAADPFVHNQIPFFIYVGSVVVATWFCGVGGGVLATVVSAFAGNYFFVPPRHDVAFTYDDVVAMALFAVVSLGLVWLVGRWRRAEAELTQSRELFRISTLAAEVGVWTWIPATNTATVAANWRALFDVPEGADAGYDTWLKAVHPDDRPEAARTFAAAWQERRDFTSEHRVVRRDGTVRWLVTYGGAFYDEAGTAAGMAGVVVDITKRRAAEEAATEANRLKDDFLATLSHELRTPLGAILGWSDMLLRHGLEGDTARKALEAIHRNARAQSTLIADVLDVSRIISGKLRLNLGSVDLSAVLQAALETTKPAADAKRIEVRTSVDPGLPRLTGDSDRLQQVLWNLLSNSVKFANPGGHVAVSITRAGFDIELRVRDDGIGIPRDFLPYVFDRFRQRDSSTTRTHQGLGLGLAIVRHLTEMHGGTVEANSDGEGCGAEFIVRLPARRERRRPDPSSDKRDRSLASASADLSGVRAVVVDDEPDSLALIDAMLKQKGAQVVACATASECIAAIERERPDVLVADIAMPEVDGYEMLARIRVLPGCDTLPAVALTAFGSPEDRQRALDSGFSSHLAKPVTAEELASALDEVVVANR